MFFLCQFNWPNEILNVVTIGRAVQLDDVQVWIKYWMWFCCCLCHWNVCRQSNDYHVMKTKTMETSFLSPWKQCGSIIIHHSLHQPSWWLWAPLWLSVSPFATYHELFCHPLACLCLHFLWFMMSQCIVLRAPIPRYLVTVIIFLRGFPSLGSTTCHAGCSFFLAPNFLPFALWFLALLWKIFFLSFSSLIWTNDFLSLLSGHLSETILDKHVVLVLCQLHGTLYSHVKTFIIVIILLENEGCECFVRNRFKDLE